MSRIRSFIIALPLLGMVFGCAPASIVDAVKNGSAKVWIERLVFDVKEGVNNNSPVAVHLVVAYDEALNGKLAKMTADKYFKDQKQLEKDFKGAADFFKFEVAPGQRMPDKAINLSETKGLGGYIFARYSSPGPHRAAISGDRVIKVILDKIDFEIETVKE